MVVFSIVVLYLIFLFLVVVVMSLLLLVELLLLLSPGSYKSGVAVMSSIFDWVEVRFPLFATVLKSPSQLSALFMPYRYIALSARTI